MRNVFAAPPVLLLRPCVRSFCRAEVTACLPVQSSLLSVEAAAAARPLATAAAARRDIGTAEVLTYRLQIAASPRAKGGPGAGTATVHPADSSPACALPDAAPGEIVVRAHLLALSPELTGAHAPRNDVAQSETGESWCAPTAARGSRSLEEQAVKAEWRQPSYTTTGAAAAAASWGDLIFRAHGLLHAFSPSQLVLLLHSMAAAGPLSLAHCSRSRISTQQQRLQQEQRLLHVHGQRRQHLPMTQSTCDMGSQLLWESTLKTDNSAKGQLDSSSTRVRSNHTSSHVDGVSRTDTGGTVYCRDVETACSPVGSRALGAGSQKAPSASNGFLKAPIGGTNDSSMDGSSELASISDHSSTGGLPRAPRVYAHQLQGQSIDFLEAVIERVCAEHVLKQLSLDELASVINSLHLLQYAHPLLVRRLLDSGLTPDPLSDGLTGEPQDGELLLADEAKYFQRDDFSKTCATNSDNAIRGNGTAGGGKSAVEGRNTAGQPLEARKSEAGSKTAVASQHTGSTDSGRATSRYCGGAASDSSDGSCSGGGSDSGIASNCAASSAPADDTAVTAGGGTKFGPTTAAGALQQPDMPSQRNKWRTRSASSSRSRMGAEAYTVTTQQQEQTVLSGQPAGLLVDRLARRLAELEQEVHQADGSICFTCANTTSWPPCSGQTHVTEFPSPPVPSGDRAETGEPAPAPSAPSKHCTGLPVSPGSRRTVNWTAHKRVAVAGVASAECTAGPRAHPSKVLFNGADGQTGPRARTARGSLSNKIASAAGASRGSQHCLHLSRLAQIWHGCCCMGLLSPQLAAHVLAAFNISARSLGPQDLVLLIRAGAMYLTKQPLQHHALIQRASLLYLLPSRRKVPADVLVEHGDVSSGSGIAAIHAPRAIKRVPGYRESIGAPGNWTGIPSQVHTERWHKAPTPKAAAGSARSSGVTGLAPAGYPPSASTRQEGAMDAAVAELIIRSLRCMQEKMISLDMRCIALLLEAFALSSFAPEPLTSDIIERHILPQVESACPDAVTSIISSLSALKIRHVELLQAISAKLCESMPRYSPLILARLALDLAKLNIVVAPLLSEVAARMKEVETMLGRTDLTALRALLEIRGLQQSPL